MVDVAFGCQLVPLQNMAWASTGGVNERNHGLNKEIGAAVLPEDGPNQRPGESFAMDSGNSGRWDFGSEFGYLGSDSDFLGCDMMEISSGKPKTGDLSTRKAKRPC